MRGNEDMQKLRVDFDGPLRGSRGVGIKGELLLLPHLHWDARVRLVCKMGQQWGHTVQQWTKTNFWRFLSAAIGDKVDILWRCSALDMRL
jgi:hypothetical protein